MSEKCAGCFCHTHGDNSTASEINADLLAAAEGVMGDELDLSQCPYFMGTGQCSSGCYSEPSCQTDRPLNGWPKERLAAAIKKAKGQ